MVVLPLSKLPNEFNDDTSAAQPGPSPNSDSVNWLRIASAATLVTGGALLLAANGVRGLLSPLREPHWP